MSDYDGCTPKDTARRDTGLWGDCSKRGHEERMEEFMLLGRRGERTPAKPTAVIVRW